MFMMYSVTATGKTGRDKEGEYQSAPDHPPSCPTSSSLTSMDEEGEKPPGLYWPMAGWTMKTGEFHSVTL